jgi:hypothetical protein
MIGDANGVEKRLFFPLTDWPRSATSGGVIRPIMFVNESSRPQVLYVLGCLAFLGSGLSSHAIVDANSTSNTNAPADGAPWANVGRINGGASGIYIAAGWVLTAAHVGPGNLALDTITLPYDGISHRLTNADGTSTDMVLFHVNQTAPLPSLPLASSPPALHSVVDFIGCGYIAATGPIPIGSYTGFTWAPTAVKAWGNNKVSSINFVYNAGLGNVTLFSTDFDAVAQTSDECQATDGDSGAAVYQKSGSVWQLVGMADLVSDLTNQPAGTSVFGDSTYAAQISTYCSQILAWLGSIPPTLSVTKSGDAVNVCWPDPGLAYTLQVTPTLASTAWSAVAQPQVTTNGIICVAVPTTNSASFFRLQR